MKNKVELKKHLLLAGLVLSVMFLVIGVLQLQEFNQYTKTYNQKLEVLTLRICEEYPNITEEELLKLFNEKGTPKEVSVLEKYGIDPEKDSVLLETEAYFRKYFVISMLLFLSTFGMIAGIFLLYHRKKDQELQEITKYIENINQGNYQFDMDTISEDELSILKTEVYKTTIMLREIAEHSKKDKEDLKQALSDISHQLKTPLTSILVILDNLMDEPQMEPQIRAEFLKDIKREITNINFLIQSLLKMSKLDSGTVVFFRKEVQVSELLNQVIENMGILCDLKDIEICRELSEEGTIFCDFRWQVEALTNILKNCVEYSPEGEKIQIQCVTNKVYTKITIRDYGKGIDEEDQKHIFERFYKGKNATPESVGIGLALADTIIKSDHGRVSVERAEPGTRFIVKYYKN